MKAPSAPSIHTGQDRCALMAGLVSATARLTTARVDPELDSAARAERSLMAPVLHRSSSAWASATARGQLRILYEVLCAQVHMV